MSFTFKPATRDRIGLLMAIAGSTGSGKTYSALRLAKGIANGTGTIAVIDTEAGRAKHYADKFDFLHCDFEPPFTPQRYIEAIRAAEDAGATVIVIDSMSHEWAGEGGCADMQAREAERMATDRNTGEVNPWKLEALSGPAWKRPKIEHKRMMSRLIQCRTHLIFCLRAEDKVQFIKEKDNRGKEKTSIVPMGFQPICEKGFMFEMSGSMVLHPDTPGMVRYDMSKKLNDELQKIFPDGQPITEETGARLRAWAETGKDVRVSAEDQRIIEGVRALIERVEDCTTAEALAAIVDDPRVAKQREWMKANKKDLSQALEQAFEVARAQVPSGEADPFETEEEAA